jgi:tetratricopeptide (TPR) repeat protein
VAVREIERRSAGRVNSSSTGVVESSKENLGKRLIEKEIVSGTSVSGDGGNVRGLVDDGFDEVVKQEKPSVVKSGFSDGSSAGDCAQAGAEIRSAMNESQSKEKLFRYRRALRMCPDKAEFHSALGELYLDMNRIHDAEYEFNEAVRLDPSDKKAKANLAELNGE